jgi:hypothetical protein
MYCSYESPSSTDLSLRDRRPLCSTGSHMWSRASEKVATASLTQNEREQRRANWKLPSKARDIFPLRGTAAGPSVETIITRWRSRKACDEAFGNGRAVISSNCRKPGSSRKNEGPPWDPTGLVAPSMLAISFFQQSSIRVECRQCDARRPVRSRAIGVFAHQTFKSSFASSLRLIDSG